MQSDDLACTVLALTALRPPGSSRRSARGEHTAPDLT